MSITSLRALVRKQPAVSFFIVTFSFSWGIGALIYVFGQSDAPFILHIAFAWGPLVGGAVTVWLLGENVRGWFGQIRNWRVGIHWYLLGIGIILLRGEITAILSFVLGVDVSIQLSGWQLYAMLFNFVLTLFFAGALEEFGWRGFAQVRLQQRYNAAMVNLGIGVLWATWHLPLGVMGLGGFTDPLNYLLFQIGASVFYGWLYNTTNGALLVVMVTHAASNMPGLLNVTGETPTVLDQLLISPNALFGLLVAVVVIGYAGSKTLTRNDELPSVPGRQE